MGAASSQGLWSLYPVSVPALQQERYARLHRMMEAERLDALIALAAGGLGRKGHLRYITNYGPLSRYAAVFFPRQGEPILLIPFAVHIAWAESVTWIKEVRFCADPGKELAALMQDRGLAAGRIGLAGEEVVPGLGAALAEKCPHAHWVSAAPLLTDLRMVKTPLEVALARSAATLSDAAFAETASLIAVGATEVQVFASTESRLRRMNAEEWLLLISATGDPVLPFPSSRAIAAGDLVQYSIEPVSPGGMWIQSVRMFSRGEPEPASRKIVHTIREALAEAERQIRPGAPLRNAALAIAEILEPIAPAGRIPYGHGIGMDNFESPVLGVDTNVVAAPNMLIVIHPALVIGGQGYYMGDTYLVTENGAERLSRDPLDLIVA